MSDLPPEITVLAAYCALSIPLLFAVSALLTGAPLAPALARRRWPMTITAAAAGFCAALFALAAYLLTPAPGPIILRLPLTPATSGLAPSLRIDGLTLAMLLLITFVGLAILRFSRNYLSGDRPSHSHTKPGPSPDPGQARYQRWFAATLASVSLLVVSNQLLLLCAAWIGASLSLHQLLTYYDDRPRALLAAHKKFLISRLADICLLAGCLILGLHFDSFQLDRIFAHLPESPDRAQTIATVLLAMAAILKCAQLPFHGWLIQVMEAPTPVSALLHAGIVNIGGFLMIRLAPVMTGATTAQGLLVVVGTATAVIAALAMTTRTSIKVALAWSTCAQMGFMLMECGLGLYGLALLHLLAHSLYKAHAFLGSGQTIQQTRTLNMAPSHHCSLSPARLAATLAVVALLLTAGSILAGGPDNSWPTDMIVAIAVTGLVTDGAVRRKTGGLATVLSGAVALVGLYIGWHHAFSLLIQTPAAPEIPIWQRALILTGFCALFIINGLVRSGTGRVLTDRLHPHLYAGLYLDEIFTRLTLRLWPARLPLRRGRSEQTVPTQTSSGVPS